MLNHILVARQLWKKGLGNSNEMCLQGLNLSSTRNSAFHHELALLQQATNAVGVRVCSQQKWKHEHSGMIDLATFCCRWLGNHSFHWCQLKDSCDQAFSVSLSLWILPPLKSTSTLALLIDKGYRLGASDLFMVNGLVIIHSIDSHWRICALEPFERLYRSRRFLP